jgi:hypothetical protein
MRIEPLEKGDELARAMPLGRRVMHRATQQIDCSGEGERAEPLILVITLNRGMLAGFRRQVGAVLAIAWMPGFSS